MRDQFTPAEERGQGEAQAHAEKIEGWETCPACNGHGAPQGDGHGMDDGGTLHAPACDFCDGMEAVPPDLEELYIWLKHHGADLTDLRGLELASLAEMAPGSLAFGWRHLVATWITLGAHKEGC